MTSQNITSPENQTATFIELFFDLVFVFSVTQVVGLLHHGLHWSTIGQAVLVFWLVWWAWTQFTWALNAADTTHPVVQLGILVATGVAFFMAVALPDAFHGHAWAFAVPYVLVRLVGLALYAWVAWADPAHRAAVSTFSALSMAGLVVVLLGGQLGGNLQYWMWGFAIVLDVFASLVGGRLEGWNLHPEHFGERHGLFVIIALGETLIVAAGGMTGQAWTAPLAAVSVLAVGTSCAAWWTYFARAHTSLEHALRSVSGAAQASMARDVFSLAHFPMLCGIVLYAVAIEEAVAHPDAPLALPARLALAIGILLFVGGMAAAVWRATSIRLVSRFVVSLGMAALIVGLGDMPAWGSLAIAFIAVALVAAAEQTVKWYPGPSPSA